MLRKESKAVPEGNGPVTQQEEFGPNQPTLEELCRMIKEVFEEWDRRIDKMREYTEERKSMNQRLIRLELDTRQPCLVMEADGPASTKTCESTEGAATAVQAIHGDSCSATRIDLFLMCSTSFGDDCTGPPALPYSEENALVDNGAAAPKSCFQPLEMHTTTAAGGLLPTGETSTATKITFNQPLLRV